MKGQSLKISIITAVYNREHTIGQAIDSVARQTHPDLEHLIIDGASTDGTLAAVSRHGHARMQVHSGPDSGIYDALNKGMALAGGEVLGLVHSDDFLAHDRVLAQVARAFADPAVDAVYGDLDYVAAHDAARIVRHWKSGSYHRGKLGWGWMPPHPALFLRRRVIDRHGVYDTSYRIAADYDAILRWFGHGAIRPCYIPEVLVKMRVGGESNRSLSRVLRKSREDYRALRANGIGGAGALIAKNLTKLPQFLRR